MRVLSMCCMIVFMLPGALSAADAERREAACASRCDLMRYQCAQAGNSAEPCDRGRESCMDRCLGRRYDQERARRLDRKRPEAGDGGGPSPGPL